ncbi:phosphate signaling complex protein PhoU [Sutterella sp.]|uniref:phosphate signaling complex protein PhoU n=1 Tax=Sutterella sp. TaxID=1981025 RepID=UPI0025FBAD8F|nr:phosphate signaling complex protein PhoU [uncultured Sutterella sp.]
MTLNVKKHSVKAFDAELEVLHKNILDMARAVRQQLDDVGDALMKGDTDAAEQVVARDKVINEWEMELDAFMETLISRRQPQAIDLRMLLGGCRMTNDFERMGDEIRNAAKGIRRLDMPLTGAASDTAASLVKIYALLQVMADDMIAGIDDLDLERARALVRRRTVVSSEVHESLVSIINRMKAGEISIDDGLAFIRINRALERVAAHMQNIGETVVFVVEGLDIRHDAAVQS